MTDTGTVVEIKGKLAYVETDAAGGCAACSSRNKCMMSSDSKKCTVIAKIGEVDVKVGEKVTYYFRESYFIGISFMLYLVPALITIFSAAAGYFFGSKYFEDDDTGALIGFSAGALISVLFLRFSSKISGKYPVITENLNK